jgi:phosphoheptose isomerase
MTALLSGREHVAALVHTLGRIGEDVDRLHEWGAQLADVLVSGGRLLAVGNGGSAAQAQHLTSELVGRYVDERPPFSALALHAETSSVSAIANDFGYDEVFARQVRAHGRAGDVLLALSTSGRSPNVLAAARVGRAHGLTVWALTGPDPSPLAEEVDDHVSVDAPATATVQEVHQVLLHLLCAAVDERVGAPDLRTVRSS